MLNFLKSFFETSEVTEADYKTFVDKGTVRKTVLVSISKKVQDRLDLNEKEMAIFVGKTSEINEIMRSI